MKNKNTILLVIMGILVIGLAGYIAYDKILTKEEVKEKNQQEKTEETKQEVSKEFDVEEAKKLLDDFGFNENLGCNDKIYTENYSDAFKATIVINKIDKSSQENMACKDLYKESDLEKLEGKEAYKGKTGYCIENAVTIPYDTVNETYKKMYGTDMPKQPIDSTAVSGMYYKAFYDYNEEKNLFNATSPNGLGGACTTSYEINEIKSAKEIGNKVYIEVQYYIYQDGIITTGNGKILYSIKTSKINKYFPEITNGEELVNKIRAEYMDYLDVYEVVFEKENDHYIFKSLNKKLSE